MKIRGDKFRPSAKRERELDRLLDRTRREGSGFRRPDGAPLRTGHVLAKNETGGALGFGVPAMLSTEYRLLNPLGTPIKDWDAQKLLYRLVPAINMVTGLSYSMTSVAITTEPIAAGAIGVVAIEGLAVSTVSISPASFFRPTVGSVTTSGWGWGRLIADSPGSENFTVVDLSACNFIARYEITGISGGTITAKIDPGHASEFSSTLLDTYSIASWQVVGDTGQCTWNGNAWVITNPWCAD
jgi:hypothetical protein